MSYNIILWLCGSLPWEKIREPVTVQKEKEKAFNNIDNFLDKCFDKSVPQAVHRFMTLLAGVKFNEIPSYEKLKEILIAGIKKLNHKPDGKLKLNSIDMATQQTIPKHTPQKIKKPINGMRKSPRAKYTDAPSFSMRNPRESTIGVVIDKKRGNIKDIQKVLNDIDSDGEYDIQILKKTRKTESTEKASKVVTKVTKNTASSSRKKISVDSIKDDSEDDSNIEVITVIYLKKCVTQLLIDLNLVSFQTYFVIKIFISIILAITKTYK